MLALFDVLASDDFFSVRGVARQSAGEVSFVRPSPEAASESSNDFLGAALKKEEMDLIPTAGAAAGFLGGI